MILMATLAQPLLGFRQQLVLYGISFQMKVHIRKELKMLRWYPDIAIALQRGIVSFGSTKTLQNDDLARSDSPPPT